MQKILELGARDIEILHGDGGIPFRDFMKRLLYTHAQKIGVKIRALSGDSENRKDGGIDFLVDEGKPDESTGFLSERSCWQFKGTEKNPSDAAMRKEINKPFAKKCILEGYAYRLCMSSDLTSQSKKDAEALLLNAAQEINPKAAAPQVYGASEISKWATSYPGLILRYKNLGSNLQTLEVWGQSFKAITPTYVTNPAWNATSDLIQSHVEFSKKSSTACVKVGGAAGVGKSRLVYEVLNFSDSFRNLCVYTRDEVVAVQFANELAARPELSAVLIADECLIEGRYQLEQILAGAMDRVRVVVINNSREQADSMAPEASVEKLPDDVLENVLEANFPEVAPEIRKVAINLSKGFVRLAVDICRHDGDLARADLPAYLHSRVKEKLQALEALSLFERVGFKEGTGDEKGISEQITSAGKATGFDANNLRDLCRSMKDQPGFVIEAGRYIYVTPEAVAQVCFNNGWRRWVEPNIDKFYSNLPEPLRQSFQNSVKKNASADIRESFGSYMQQKAAEFTERDLLEKKKANDFLKLVETNPGRFLPRLRVLVTLADEAQLFQISGEYDGDGWGTRRNIVWLCQRLAPFPEYFYDVEEILFRLALTENEPNIGNNSSEIWLQLYRIYLSGTSLDFFSRQKVLRKRLTGGTVAGALLAIKTLNEVFSSHLTGMGHPPLVAGRIPPPNWQPKNRQELTKCFDEAFEFLKMGLHDSRTEVRLETQRLLANHTRYLLVQGRFDLLLDGFFTKLDAKIVSILLEQIGDFMSFDAKESEPDYLARIKIWQRSLIPEDDLTTKVKILLSQRNRWFAEESERAQFDRELDELAEQVFHQRGILKGLLDWLCSNEASFTFEFGSKLARIDFEVELFDLFKNKVGEQSPSLTRGYIWGLGQRDVFPLFVKEWIESLKEVFPETAVTLAGLIPKHYEAFTMAVELFEREKLRPRLFEVFLYRNNDPSPSKSQLKVLLNVLLKSTEAQRGEALAVGTDIVMHWVREEKRAGRNEVAQSKELVDLFVRFLNGRAEGVSRRYNWGQLARFLVSLKGAAVAKRCVQGLVDDDYGISGEAEAILATLVVDHAILIAEELGKLLRSKSGWKLEIRGFGSVIRKMPPELLVRFLETQPSKVVVEFCRNLPRPYLDENKNPLVPALTEAVLEKFGEDEKVMRAFSSPHGVRTYSGDISESHMEEAKIADKFLTHPLSAIRFWARIEAESSRRQAEWWKQKTAEERFQ